MNEFQQNVVKLESLWTMVKEKLENSKVTIRSKIREEKELSDKQEYELKIYQEKVKHLLHDHESSVTDLRKDGENIYSKLQSDNRDKCHQLMMNSRYLLVSQKYTVQKHNQLMNDYKKEQEFKIMQLRQNYCQKISNMKNEVQEKMRQLRVECIEKRKLRIKRIENIKNNDILQLMSKHKQSLVDIKNYYSDITHANLDLIKSLKGEVSEMQKKEKNKETSMLEMASMNRQLSEPLKEYLIDIEKLKEQLKTYSNEKDLLNQTTIQINKFEKSLNNLQWKYDILNEKYILLCKDYQLINTNLQNNILDIKQKANLKNILLNESINDMKKEIEKQDISIVEIVSSMNISQSDVKKYFKKDKIDLINKKLDQVINEKNAKLKYLQLQEKEIKSKYINAIQFYQQLMQSHNIPFSQLQFVPKPL